MTRLYGAVRSSPYRKHKSNVLMHVLPTHDVSLLIGIKKKERVIYMRSTATVI